MTCRAPGATMLTVPPALEQLIVPALRSTRMHLLVKTLTDAAVYAHPDTTQVRRTAAKADGKRLHIALDDLIAASPTRLIALGDQVADALLPGALGPCCFPLHGVIVDTNFSRAAAAVAMDGANRNGVQLQHWNGLPSDEAALDQALCSLEG